MSMDLKAAFTGPDGRVDEFGYRRALFLDAAEAAAMGFAAMIPLDTDEAWSWDDGDAAGIAADFVAAYREWARHGR